VWNIEYVERGARDRMVAERVQVEPIVSPVALILQLLERPLVDDHTIVTLRDLAHVLVVDRDLAANRAEHRLEIGVDPGKDQHGGAGRAKLPQHILQLGRDIVGIAARSDHIVAARADAHEVGTEVEGRGQLLLGDLMDQLAPHREVRVGKVGTVPVEYLSEAVGPTAQASGAVR